VRVKEREGARRTEGGTGGRGVGGCGRGIKWGREVRERGWGGGKGKMVEGLLGGVRRVGAGGRKRV